jgi:hypothetical protein
MCEVFIDIILEEITIAGRKMFGVKHLNSEWDLTRTLHCIIQTKNE